MTGPCLMCSTFTRKGLKLTRVILQDQHASSDADMDRWNLRANGLSCGAKVFPPCRPTSGGLGGPPPRGVFQELNRPKA